MHHRKLTAEQEDGIYERIMVPRARNKFGINLAAIEDDVHDWIMEMAFQRIVRRGQWNLRRALLWMDNQVLAYLARRGDA